MVSATRTWYRIQQKIFAVLSIIGGLIVILACSFTLYSLSSPKGAQPETNSTESNEAITENPKSVPTTANKNTIKFDGLPGQLRTTILACGIVAILGCVCQVFSSILVLSMCTKRFGDRPKWWLAAHALSLVVMLTCFFIPMSFHPEHGGTLTIKALGHSIHSHFSEILMGAHSIQHLLKDLHAYLIVLAINGVLVLLLLGFNLACMCCGLKPYEDIDDNQSNIGLNDRSKLVKPYSRYD